MNNIRKQVGYTLVELMIAAALGLLLLGGAINVFLSASQTSSLTRSIADIQERARFLSGYLSDEIERAGWVDPSTNFTIEQGIIFGTGASVDDVSICDTAQSLTNRCDQIQISYTDTADCLGGQVNGGAIGVVVNTYYVENGDFMCRGNAATSVASGPAAIINDVESFQVLYGLDDSNTAGMPYTNNSSIDNITDRYIEALDRMGSTINLMSVRYAVLLRSEEPNAYDETVESNFTLFNEDTLSYDDRRLRILLTVTSVVANNF